jgi:hypothetical protein
MLKIARDALKRNPDDKFLEGLLAGYDYQMFKEGRGKPS